MYRLRGTKVRVLPSWRSRLLVDDFSRRQLLGKGDEDDLKVFLASSSEEEEDVEAKQARIRKKYSALLQEIKPQEEVRPSFRRTC